MREIKFRGRRLDNGEWVHGSLLLLNDQAELFLTHNRALVEDYLMINDHFREPAKKTEKGVEV